MFNASSKNDTSKTNTSKIPNVTGSLSRVTERRLLKRLKEQAQAQQKLELEMLQKEIREQADRKSKILQKSYVNALTAQSYRQSLETRRESIAEQKIIDYTPLHPGDQPELCGGTSGTKSESSHAAHLNYCDTLIEESEILTQKVVKRVVKRVVIDLSDLKSGQSESDLEDAVMIAHSLAHSPTRKINNFDSTDHLLNSSALDHARSYKNEFSSDTTISWSNPLHILENQPEYNCLHHNPTLVEDLIPDRHKLHFRFGEYICHTNPENNFNALDPVFESNYQSVQQSGSTSELHNWFRSSVPTSNSKHSYHAPDSVPAKFKINSNNQEAPWEIPFQGSEKDVNVVNTSAINNHFLNLPSTSESSQVNVEHWVEPYNTSNYNACTGASKDYHTNP
jgi:hypothetical protein